MAACQACDANFSIYRKFGWLHNRVLLHLQAELSKLEFDLQTIDDKQAESREFKERVGLTCDGREKSRKKGNAYRDQDEARRIRCPGLPPTKEKYNEEANEDEPKQRNATCLYERCGFGGRMDFSNGRPRCSCRRCC